MYEGRKYLRNRENLKKALALALILCFTTVLVAESCAFTITDLNGLELLETDSNSDAEKDSEQDLSEKELYNDLSGSLSKHVMASEITSKAFNSIRFNLDGAYQKIVVPPPED